MKYYLKLAILAAVAVNLPAFSMTLRTQADRLSYTIGNEIGVSFRSHGQTLNPAIVNQGLQDGLAGRQSKLSRAEKKQVMLDYQKSMLAKAHKQMKAASKTNGAAGAAFLKANATKSGVKVTSSGLQYKVITPGSGAKPSATDTVTVDYQGSLINGTVFDSSYKRGQPAEFPVNQVIPGWTQALQMMPTGATWMLYIPANLAYGENGMPMAGIEPNSVLVFKVHLISIKHS